MTTWIDFFVYAAFALVFWACIPAWSRFTIPVVAARNPDWLSGHPDVERRLTGTRWFRRSCLIWSALSIATLFAAQVGAWPLSSGAGVPAWETLKDLNSALAIAGLLYVLVCLFLFERWLRTNVPLAVRREATLVPRSIHDYVPRSMQLVVYGFVIGHLAAWLFVGLTGRSRTPGFWGALAFQCALSGILVLILSIAVGRKPNAVDRILGPGYRCTGVRVAFLCQLAPLMNGVARLYEQTGGTTPDSLNRGLHLGLVAAVAALAAAVTMWRPPADDGGRSPSSGSLKSLPAS
jgi:hypothetical protein